MYVTYDREKFLSEKFGQNILGQDIYNNFLSSFSLTKLNFPIDFSFSRSKEEVKKLFPFFRHENVENMVDKEF